MNKKIILAGIVVIIALVFFVYKQVTTETETSFYARITDIFGTSAIVLGIPENDINHRGKFQFDIGDEKINILDVNGNKTDRVNLKVGVLVRVTYKGLVLEISPVIIQDVISVQIIEK
jgi:hypothetical protein